MRASIFIPCPTAPPPAAEPCEELFTPRAPHIDLPPLPPAAETCEELFTPRAPHIDLALSGVEIFSNGSGSHHQLRKLDQRLDLIRGATAKVWTLFSCCLA